MKRDEHYMLVISRGVDIIIRTPARLPRWRTIMKALTPIMRDHGLRQKDIYGVEGIVPLDQPQDLEDQETRQKLDAAFLGDRRFFKNFELYDWRGDEFVLARARQL